MTLSITRIKAGSGLGLKAEISDLTEGQNLILPLTSAMLASNDDLRKSITFLTPGVNLVGKICPSEPFIRMEHLKSLDEIRNCSNSAWVYAQPMQIS